MNFDCCPDRRFNTELLRADLLRSYKSDQRKFEQMVAKEAKDESLSFRTMIRLVYF
jgi:hypothetical protein